MEEESIGTTVGTKPLSTIAPNEKLRAIIDSKIKDLCKIFYAASALFHLDVFRNIDVGILPTITKGHINRCINLVRGGGQFRRKKDKQGNFIPLSDDVIRLLESYAQYDFIFKKKIKVAKFKSGNRPLEYAATELFTNIRVQISEHYERYQRSYLLERLKQHLKSTDFKELKKMQLRAAAHRIQWAVNGTGIVKKFKDKNIPTELREQLMPYLQELADIIHAELPSELKKLSETSRKKLANIPIFTTYMQKMASYLTFQGVPSFSPLPNSKLRRRNFLFDKRFLCTVYNEWKDTKIGIKAFEANYEQYYREMFMTHKVYPKKYAQMVPKSYSTNGVTVSIIFSPDDDSGGKKKKKTSKKPKGGKKQAEDTVIKHPIKGFLKPDLYDADSLRASGIQMNKYHITVIDPGNKGMLTCTTYDGDYDETYTINKGFYNEISHITRNTKKKKELTEANLRVSTIHQRLSNTSLKGGLLESYLTYLMEIVSGWDILWEFEFQKKLATLKYDTYLHSKMAVAKICKKIRGKNKSKKPSLIILGKGNGSMTISNTKHSSSHGPIKKIALALSLLVPVILTDEYLTSQRCNRCTEKLTYPKMDHRKKIRTIMRKLTIRANTKEEYLRLSRLPSIKKLQVVEYKKAWKVCYCSCKNHLNKSGKIRNILWKRDDNSTRCILRVALGKVTCKPLKAFTRGDKVNKPAGGR